MSEMTRGWIKENSKDLINKRKSFSEEAEVEYYDFMDFIHKFCNEFLKFSLDLNGEELIEGLKKRDLKNIWNRAHDSIHDFILFEPEYQDQERLWDYLTETRMRIKWYLEGEKI